MTERMLNVMMNFGQTIFSKQKRLSISLITFNNSNAYALQVTQTRLPKA